MKISLVDEYTLNSKNCFAMDFDEFKRLFERKRGQKNLPTNAHLSFIPTVQKSGLLFMTSSAGNMWNKQHMPTVFIGTIRLNYDERLWDEDVLKWKQHIGSEGIDYYEIQLRPLIEDDEILDSADAIPKIEAALEMANKLPADSRIRVINLGTGYSNFLYHAVTYLLKEWRDTDGKFRVGKHMQFVTSGDTLFRDLADFCKWLCISDTCQSVEFYNTNWYHPFGRCDEQYQPRRE